MKNIHLLLLLFLSGLTGLYSCYFSKSAARYHLDLAKTKSYDIIAVPGVPFQEPGWDKTMKSRVYWAKYLFDKGIAKNIIFSGSSVSSPFYEAKIMALYAIAIGIPKEHVFVEIKAQHSTENFYYAFLKAKKLGFKHIALATEPFQAMQLKRFAKMKIGKIDVIPFVKDTLKAMEPYMIDPVIDYMQAFNENFVPINVRESYWRRQNGTRGMNIDPNAY